MEKHIANIVFYKFYEGTELVKKSCVFYDDGTVANGTYEEGLQACKVVAKDLHITSADAFKEMINKNIIHVMSGDDFKERFSSFVVTKEVEEVEEIAKGDEVEVAQPEVIIPAVPTYTETLVNAEPEVEVKPEVETEVEPEVEEETEELNDAEDSEIEETDEYIADGVETEEFDEDTIEDAELLEEEPEKEGFFKRIVDKIKQKLKVGALFVTTAAVGLLGLTGCEAKPKTKEGQMAKSNLVLASQVEDEDLDLDVLNTGNNADYSDYEVQQLLDVTERKTQKKAMTAVSETLRKFNYEFANYYIEEGKEVNGQPIKPALKFDEVVALQQAYNDYTKEELRVIFNGAEIDAEKMTRDYKSASLQLMGAYVIESPEHPVDISDLLVTEEAKTFYEKYHKMFLEAKSVTTYEEKAAKMTEFYRAIKADFPITQKIRTEGIAHADAYSTIKSYKLAVAPMVAAAEMMYQNLETDVTLSDEEIEFFNDIGLCNYADDKFERLETITLSATEDLTNPSYEQYRRAIMNAYEYDLIDEMRDLSQLDAFQRAVNWHFEIMGEGSYSEQTRTYTTYETYTESHTTYRTEETRTNKPITPEAKAKIDAEIEAENEAARAAAEAAGEKRRQELQEEADKEAVKIEKEIKEEQKDLEEKIEQANEQIEKNHDDNPSNDKPVNEKDLGHGVDFDDAHSDSQGNLNNSVEDITTDPAGAVEYNDPLPDPNVTGAQFDSQAGTFYGDNGYSYDTPSYEYNTPSYEVTYEYNTPSYEVSYEQAVDSYVENMAGNEYGDEGYQYTYSN